VGEPADSVPDLKCTIAEFSGSTMPPATHSILVESTTRELSRELTLGFDVIVCREHDLRSTMGTQVRSDVGKWAGGGVFPRTRQSGTIGDRCYVEFREAVAAPDFLERDASGLTELHDRGRTDAKRDIPHTNSSSQHL
jgi:hypothetical protein